MQKWEYKTIYLKLPKFKEQQEFITSECNKYGEKGWELVNNQIDAIVNGYAYLTFKRPKEEK